MAEKTVKRIVTHPKQYFAVGGKLQRMAVGTEVTLSEKEAERLKRRVADPSKVKLLEGGKLVDKGAVSGGGNALQELGQQLAAAQDDVKRLTTENAALKKRIK